MHSLPYDEADSQSVHPTRVYMESTGQIIIVMGVRYAMNALTVPDSTVST